MTTESATQTKLITARPLRLPSIRWVVTGVVLVPVVLTSAVLLILTGASSRRAAESLVGTLMTSVTVNVQGEVREHLAAAVHVSDLYASRLHEGILKPDELAAWVPTLAEDLTHTPSVASIAFGNAAGEVVWVHRRDGALEVGRVEPGKSVAIEYAVSESGHFEGKPLRTRSYVLTERPWYAAAMRATTPVWTQIYPWLNEGNTSSTTGIGYARAIRDDRGGLRGVLVVDVTLHNLSAFLSQRPVARVGSIYIVDRDRQLVAASSGNVSGADGRRLTLADLDDPMARAAAEALATIKGTDAAAPATVRKIEAREPVRVRIVSDEPSPGLQWRVIAALPESAFLSNVRRGYRHGVAMAALAAAGCAAIGLLLGRRLSRPIGALSSQVREISRGRFDQRLTPSGAREFGELADEVNRMAAGLERRVEMEQALNVATEVQQALLPSAGICVSGLEALGRASYAEKTGGDYFDFIPYGNDLAKPPLLVLGDVSGHGIGAALLMATARAGLRSILAAGVPLPQLMTRLNTLLAESARPGNFMTLLLVHVDVTAGTVTWASAGHDPMIVCPPDGSAPFELDGAGVPLGILADTTYEHFSRSGIAAGTLLFLGTDGIWDMRNDSGESFGKERLRAFLRANRDGSVAQIADRLDAHLAAFRQNTPHADDLTYVVVKLLPPATATSAAAISSVTAS